MSSQSSGTPTSSTSATENTTKRSGVRSFQSYRARKEEERSKFFKNCSTKTKKVKLEANLPKEVKINIGVLILKDGKLSLKRVATLPLTVAPTIGSEELLAKAVKKHTRFNEQLFKRHKVYRLLYADYKEVTTIPGSEEPFTLSKYKEEIDKPYSRINFFLVSAVDYCSSKMDSDDSDCSNEDPACTSVSDAMHVTQNYFNANGTLSSQENVEEQCVHNTTEAATSSDATANVDANETDGVMALPQDQQHVQCPVCLASFPLSEIVAHADTCSMWLLEDDDDVVVEFSELNETSSTVGNECVSSVGAKEVLIQEISCIASTVLSEEPKRLTVRRKFIWQDFKNEHQKRFTSKDRLKVIFSGEPAVDDGGPRRELFSGIKLDN